MGVQFGYLCRIYVRIRKESNVWYYSSYASHSGHAPLNYSLADLGRPNEPRHRCMLHATSATDGHCGRWTVVPLGSIVAWSTKIYEVHGGPFDATVYRSLNLWMEAVACDCECDSVTLQTRLAATC